MNLRTLPQADFFDSVQPLEGALEEARPFFSPAPSLCASLPSFMMWQDSFTYGLVRKGDLRAVLALYGKNVYLPAAPLPFTSASLEAVFDYLRRVNGPGPGISRVEGLTEDQMERAGAWGFPTRLVTTEYLYDRSALSGLHGDPYRAKRAELNHLTRSHSVVMRPYRKADLTACGELFEVWKGRKKGADPAGGMGAALLRSAQKAHLRVLREGEDWGMQAWVVQVDGRLAAYSAGAPLSPGTYGIFLEVADLTLKGLSAYIFASLCRQLEGNGRINAGDAEGLPGLAEAKEHWHPVEHLRVYAADPKERG